MGTSTPPTTRTTGKSSGPSTDATAAKVVALLESLHAKIDAMPKCECYALKQEIEEMKAALAKSVLSPPVPSTECTYSQVKKAISDAATYAEKAKRAVWVGREEAATPEETSKADQKDIEALCHELNDPSISQALNLGTITHHRHPETKGDRKRRILKIGFPDDKMRNHFLSLARTHRPTTVSKTPGNFIRRDLCPFELELERKARCDAFSLNCKIGGLAYGVRDDKLIKFNGSLRPLPNGYVNRPPRGYLDTSLLNDHPSIDISHLTQSNIENSFNAHDLSSTSVSPMQKKPIAKASTTKSDTGTKA